MRDVVLIRAADGTAIDAVLRRTLDILDRVYRGEAPRTHQVWSHAGSGLAMIQSTAAGAADAIVMDQGRHGAFTYTGFVTTPAVQPADLRGQIYVTFFGGRFVVEQSPGGIYTCFHVDARRRRCHIWSSHAGVEGLFVTRGDDCLAISNRPLLSHLVGKQQERPTMSRRWAARVLLGNSTLWDDTPFEDTTQPPPRAMLVLEEGELRHAEHPVPLATAHHADRDPAGIEALNAANLQAVSVLRRWPRGELWLSGGKDSRYVAALVKQAGIDVDMVTHAHPPTTGEGPAAAAVATALGLPLRFETAWAISTGDELLPTMLANLRRADGLLAETRQLAYRPPRHGGNAVIQGQAHHPRGGARTRMVRSFEHMRDDVLLPANMGDQELVVDELVRERRQRLDQIIGSYQVSHASELAYWMYSDWRMTRWTIGAYLAASRSRPVVWPMMDERVLQVCSRLSVFDRVSEVAFFTAMCALSPELARVPLYEDTWKFDQGDLGPKEFPDGCEQRRNPFKVAGRRRLTAERRIGTIQPMFRVATQELSYAAELRSLIKPDVLRALTDEDDPSATLGVPNKRLVSFMWKAVAVALVLQGDWLDADLT
jgi:hypothetical protein